MATALKLEPVKSKWEDEEEEDDDVKESWEDDDEPVKVISHWFLTSFKKIVRIRYL